MKQDRIYLSGAITDLETGEPMVGFARKFLRAESRLKRQGQRVVNPCRFLVAHRWVYRLLGLTWRGWRPRLSAKVAYRRVLVYDLWRLSHCDAICMLPGYYHSNGARAERKMAMALGMPVMYETVEVAKLVTDEERRKRKQQKRRRQKARRRAEEEQKKKAQ